MKNRYSHREVGKDVFLGAEFGRREYKNQRCPLCNREAFCRARGTNAAVKSSARGWNRLSGGEKVYFYHAC